MHLTSKLCMAYKGSARKKKFIDSLRLYLKGGAGGTGYPRCGGIGGSGGDVYVIGKKDISLLNIMKTFPSKRISATQGANAHHRCIVGQKGEDVTIDAPIGIVLYDHTGNKIGELNHDGDKIKVVSGGLGGRPETGFSGLKGESQVVTFDLKLIADVGLIGFPNAGKSTLLTKISNARPKVASYPFTTIQPELGVINYDDYRSITVADLPGLIEGAHVNFGMGHKFLKHIERTKLLLVIVDVEGFRLSPKHPFRTCLETILLLNKELELYRQELLNYPTMLIVNKMDRPGSSDVYKSVCTSVDKLEDTFHDVPEFMRPEKPFEFQKIIGISAKNEDTKEIDSVQKCIRDILDETYCEDILENEAALVQYLSSRRVEAGPKIV